MGVSLRLALSYCLLASACAPRVDQFSDPGAGGTGGTGGTGGGEPPACGGTERWQRLASPPAHAPLGASAWSGSAFYFWPIADTSTADPVDIERKLATYDPAMNEWATLDGPEWAVPSYAHLAGFVGERFVISGGSETPDPFVPAPQSAMYDTEAHVWSSVPVDGAPSARFPGPLVCTATQMIVWGGQSGGPLGDGAAWNSAAAVWKSISATGAPSPRRFHTAIWAGTGMIIWGGLEKEGPTSTGGVYDPVADTWKPTSQVGAPTPRHSHGALWTGTRMIVWGGQAGAERLSTGGAYDPETDTWTAISDEAAPVSGGWPAVGFAGTDGLPVVWTGDRMIAFGTDDSGITPVWGGLYDPAADRWTPMAPHPSADFHADQHVAWDGCRMILIGWLQSSNPNGDPDVPYTFEAWSYEPPPHEGSSP